MVREKEDNAELVQFSNKIKHMKQSLNSLIVLPYE